MVDGMVDGTPKSAFARFDPGLQEKIVSVLGWSSLRPVQELATHAILDGNNTVILAPTAGGKTEASLFPVISGCLRNQELGLRVLYVCPTRALINNQEERISKYATMVGLNAFKWHGDVGSSARKAFLKEPAEILLTTPESLEVMLVSSHVPTQKLFRNLKYVIIDEIHALAASDRGSHLLCTLERIRPYCSNDFQRIGLSATVGNPQHILTWLQGSSQNPPLLVDPPKNPSKKQISLYLSPEQNQVVTGVLEQGKGKKSLVFCESRRLSETISGTLKHTGEPVFVHHSSLSKEAREEAEFQFSQGTEACIVCTSTMELGIDVGDLDTVMQINAPSTVSSFLQRLGRTGRRQGTVANTVFFIQKEQYFLQALAIVELAKQHWVEPVQTPNRAWHMFLHQIMGLCLERGAITQDLPYQLLSKVGCFSGITKEEAQKFIGFLVSKDFLHDDGGGYLSMGLQAEKEFGRKNFMELYSVFSTPVEFEVITLSGECIGTVEWSFLEKLMEQKGSFYLSGQPWVVERIEWKKKLVMVSRAPSGTIPKWGGLSPQFLSYELVRTMRNILVSNQDIPWIDEDGSFLLSQLRTDAQPLLSDSFAPMDQDEKGLVWWTYAGGKINNTLRYGLKAERNLDIQATNISLRILSDGLSQQEFFQYLDAMIQPEWWTRPEFTQALFALMPNYRLSKFQDYLPGDYQIELIANSILDVDATRRFLVEWREDLT